MKMQQIAHAQGNWEKPVNDNFAALTKDTGWIRLSVLAPFSGDVFARKYGNMVELLGAVTRTKPVTGFIKITTLPSNLLSNDFKGFGIIAYTARPHAYANLTIDTDGITFRDCTTDDIEAPMRFDKTIIG
ncbi:hypothetical protein [Loigolactobacillus rennini]|uniref:Uncharacterized protein n=1 Tax=Loigolactobacillus rennini DSM 20253 TaxID=1423796 RepID=A0A0R2CZQ7_9LACO|nr:hypothetical protein [Loigolactobacillus rennini]KRM92787.1 hypothetical protein FC24_GL000955 [Loigolactobacillus rennini DSM 20253]